MSNVISFPGLGLFFDPPKVAFSVFGHDIYWYGIIIAFGFMLAFLYGMKRCEQFGFNQDQLIDILFVATPVAIICARAYYVIFNYEQFATDPARIFQIWTGGLAVYGSVIGGLIAGAVMAKIKKIKIGALLDLAVLGFLIGQAIGRWGNFINREAYGYATSLPWRMEITDIYTGMRSAVHPTFLYESLWNALGFVLLHFASKRRKYDGQTFLTYLAWYGLGRGIIEGFRSDSLYFLGTDLRVSQVLAFSSCLVALLILAYNAMFRRFDPEDMQAARYEARKKAAGTAAAGIEGTTTIETAETVETAEAGSADAGLTDPSKTVSEPEPDGSHASVDEPVIPQEEEPADAAEKPEGTDPDDDVSEPPKNS